MIKLERLEKLHENFTFRFVGNPPLVFKPGMPFEGAVAVRYHDQVCQKIYYLFSKIFLFNF